MNPLLAARIGFGHGMRQPSKPSAPAPKQSGNTVDHHIGQIKKHHAVGDHHKAKVSALNLAKLLGGMQSGASQSPPNSPPSGSTANPAVVTPPAA